MARSVLREYIQRSYRMRRYDDASHDASQRRCAADRRSPPNTAERRSIDVARALELLRIRIANEPKFIGSSALYRDHTHIHIPSTDSPALCGGTRVARSIAHPKADTRIASGQPTGINHRTSFAFNQTDIDVLFFSFFFLSPSFHFCI